MLRFVSIALLLAGWTASAARASEKEVWVDVGSGCKASFPEAPRPEEKNIWIGPCKNGRIHGAGYWITEDGENKTVWQQTYSDGQFQAEGTAYGGRAGGPIYVRQTGGELWYRIAPGDAPRDIREYLVEGKLPKRVKAPSGATKRASDAKLKSAIARAKVSGSGQAGDPEWVRIGEGSEIDGAALFVVVGNPDLYIAYERFEGGDRSRPVYVTCDPLAWGHERRGLGDIDHSVPYQANLVREVCRRTELASTTQVTPLHARAPHARLMAEQKHAEAFELAKREAESGDREWLSVLAWHYWNGLGVEKNEGEGTRLYRRAAELGDPTGMNQLGYALMHGRGIDADPEAARAWLERAAAAGNATGLLNLAWLYENGRGVPQNFDAALAYANQAKERKHPGAGGVISRIAKKKAEAPLLAQRQVEETRRRQEQAAREEEAREQMRRIEREERLERAREEREEQEARDRQWMDMAQTIVQGAAAMKRQNDELAARRRAERERIERDNARYREMRAEQDQRWLAENQRRQQALEQRAQQGRLEEQRRRVAAATPQPPRRQRVNLPKHTGCIRLEWGKNIPKNVDQWYHLHNTCAYPVEVHWCDRPGCQRSTAMATIPSGGKNSSWLLKKNGVSVSVLAACQTRNGNEDVNYDYRDNQCWSMVTMN